MIFYLDVVIDDEKKIGVTSLAKFCNWESKECHIFTKKYTFDTLNIKESTFLKKFLFYKSILTQTTVDRANFIVFNGYIKTGDCYGSAVGAGWQLASEYPRIPIIGITKNKVLGMPVLYKRNIPCLYITAERIETFKAANLIKSMHGALTYPTICKKVRRACWQAHSV